MASVSVEGDSGMVSRFRSWLQGRMPTHAMLVAYLDSLPAEGDWLELKACEAVVGFGVSRSVAAFANSPSGGEVFVGVTNDRRVVGTTSTHQQVEQVLRQENAPPEPWYVVDLLRAVQDITPVPVGEDSGKTVFVLDVVPLPLPTFVREESGGLVLYLRSGSSSVRASSIEALRWNRQSTRARLLLTIYREFEVMVRQVRLMHGYPIRTSWGIPPRLPFLARALEEGTFYTYLEPDDIRKLLGTRGQGPNPVENGFLTSFLDLEADVARARESVARWGGTATPWEREQQALNQLTIHADLLDGDLARFRDWLGMQGVIARY